MKISTNIPTEDRDFFLLLRAGLWQNVEEALSENPDWARIYRLACEQTVQGIVADGIALYKLAYPDLKIPGKLFEEFMSQTAQIVRQNYKVNQTQAKLCGFLRDNELFHIILKGQGVAQNYAKPMLRCSGDIDLFFTERTYQSAKALLKPMSSFKDEKPLTLECSYVISGVDVELHGAMTSGINKAADSHLQTILNKVIWEGDTRTVNIAGCDTKLPSVNFDAIYILTHTIRHLGTFGISLRQVIDWTMHMHANAGKIDGERLRRDIHAMHMEKLWRLFTDFAVQWLGMEPNQVCTLADSPSCQSGQLWEIIRASGSFGRKNPYFSHLHAGRLNERLARIYYHVRQAFVVRKFDAEFSNFLLHKELRDIAEAPFRFLSGNKTKITE